MTADAMLPYRLPRSAVGRVDTFAEGRVFDITPEGARFTVKSWDGGKHVFGPAPWPAHSGAQPARGARALVVFVGDGISNPWILGWWE